MTLIDDSGKSLQCKFKVEMCFVVDPSVNQKAWNDFVAALRSFFTYTSDEDKKKISPNGIEMIDG